MAGRGMGCATRGGGAVGSGPRNKMVSEPSKTTGPVMMAKGGMATKMGKAVKRKTKDVEGRAMKMMGGGMMKYKKGGMAKSCD